MSRKSPRRGRIYDHVGRRVRPQVEVDIEVRHQILKRKSRAGVEYTVYKPVLIKK